MRNFLTTMLALGFSIQAWSSDCTYSQPDQKTISYEAGQEIPVFAGTYQFNLFGVPKALIATDGVMALYPKGEYVSYQLITQESLDATFKTFNAQHLTPAIFERYIYGLDSMETLGESDQERLASLRSDLGVNCLAEIILYEVGNKEVIWHEDKSNGLYRLIFFSGDLSHLITIKGDKVEAMTILRSITTRGVGNE